jgi:hypothetical protein
MQVGSATSQDTSISQDQAFAARITNLDPNTKYYFRAYAKLQGDESAYGVIDTFTTSSLKISLPNITRQTDDCSGQVNIILDISGISPSSQGAGGIVWSTNLSNMYASLTTGNVLQASTIDQAGGISLDFSIECSNTYFVRGFYQAGDETSYGPVYGFTTIEGGLWLERAPFPGEKRKGPVIFGMYDKGYLGGGSQLNPNLKDLWVYREENDSWTSLGDFEGFDLREAESIVIDEKAYIFNGLRSPARCFDQSREVSCSACQCSCPTSQKSSFCLCYNDSIFEFDPLNLSINSVVRDGISLLESASFTIEKVGYVVGGKSIVPGALYQGCVIDFCSDLVSSFNPVGKTIHEESSIPIPAFRQGRAKVVGFSLQDRGYAGLGEDCSGVLLYDFYEFDPLSSGAQWRSVMPFPGSGASVLGFATLEKGYVIVKESQGEKALWQFDPESDPINQWKECQIYPLDNHSDPTDVFMIGNRIYLYSSVDESGNNLWMYLPDLK